MSFPPASRINRLQRAIPALRYDDPPFKDFAIDAGGDYPDVHFMLGELYRGQGKREEAQGAYRRALTLNAHYSAARKALEAVEIA